MNPQELHYTQEHEWVRQAGEIVRFGITDYAQGALGDIVFVSLPQIGDTLAVGDSCGEVESTKSVSDIFSPVAGKVTAVNAALEDDPAAINADPYGSGWLVEVEGVAEVSSLLPAAEYDVLVRDL